MRCRASKKTWIFVKHLQKGFFLYCFVKSMLVRLFRMALTGHFHRLPTKYYDNMPMHCNAIFHGFRNEIFQLIICEIFLSFAPTIYCGARYHYPQSMFLSSNKKKALVNPTCPYIGLDELGEMAAPGCTWLISKVLWFSDCSKFEKGSSIKGKIDTQYQTHSLYSSTLLTRARCMIVPLPSSFDPQTSFAISTASS